MKPITGRKSLAVLTVAVVGPLAACGGDAAQSGETLIETELADELGLADHGLEYIDLEPRQHNAAWSSVGDGRLWSTYADVLETADEIARSLHTRPYRERIDEVLFQIAGDTLATGEPLPGDRLDPDLVLRFQRNRSAVTGFELDAGRVVHLRFRRVSDEP